MKHYHIAISCALVLLAVSCHGNEEEPAAPQHYRISSIQSDTSTLTFNYNSSGQVSEMDENESAPGLYILKSSYLYNEEDNLIEIVAEERTNKNTRRFEEKLYISQNGTAERATGTVTLYSDMTRLMMKNYTVDFHYNSSQQLTKIDIAEKRTNSTGWEDTNDLKYYVEMDWADDNLIRYTEYSNPDYPSVDISYTYFGGWVPDYMPILQAPILRRYYLPLQYQGIFGMQSADQLKERQTVTSGTPDGSVYKYSYDLSTSIYDTKIEAYTEQLPHSEVKYTVSWEKR